MYNHDVDIVATQLIPPHRRMPITVAWLLLLAYPLKYTWDKFRNSGTGVVAKINDRLKYNGQACYLKLALVSKICPGNPTYINIVQNDDDSWQIYWYNEADAQEDMFLFNVADEADDLFEETYLYNSSDFAGEWDFSVVIHASLDTNEIKTLIADIVNVYKLAGKRFGITIAA